MVKVAVKKDTGQKCTLPPVDFQKKPLINYYLE